MQALFAATTLALVAGGASAADRVDLQKLNVGQLKKQNAAASSIATMAHERHAQLLGMDSESRLVLKARNADYGVRNTRYQQTFRGVPVFGEQVIVSEDGNGEVRALFGRKTEGLASEIGSVQGKLGSAQALAIGKRAGLGNRTADREPEVGEGDLRRRQRPCAPGVFRVVLRRFARRRLADASVHHRRCQQRQDPQAVGKPAARPDRHRPRRQRQDRPVRVRHHLRLQRRDAERHHLHDEQHQRQDGQPQPRHQRQHGVLVHLPAQHREGHQRRVFAAERRALLRQRRLQHVPGVHGRTAVDLPAADARALQQQLRKRDLERLGDDLRRRRQHVLSAGQPRRVRARGFARLHRAAVRAWSTPASPAA